MNPHPQWNFISNRGWANMLLDLEFDTLGGELTLAQVRCPLPIYADEDYPGQYRQRRARRLRQQARDKEFAKLARLVAIKQPYLTELEQQRGRYAVVKNRFNTAIWKLQNPQIEVLHRWRNRYSANQYAVLKGPSPLCRSCMPYNGSHTPHYWGAGQKDPW